MGVAILFAALFRYQSVWNPGAFDRPIETTLDSFYFSVVTLATVGYGDIHPVGSVAKILVIIEVLLGILLLAIMVGAAISVTFHEISNKLEKHNNKIQPTPDGDD
ncbi:potassium channel family protein [Methylobacter sp.]|uniref:potassium channel family protein n=1 Tax=Methylobacter sp. TaxID=2051955 RepID=UPI0025E0503B|nr:potassium channel family protein [Methylobacter sp.]